MKKMNDLLHSAMKSSKSLNLQLADCLLGLMHFLCVHLEQLMGCFVTVVDDYKVGVDMGLDD